MATEQADPNIISISVLGIGVSAKITGIRSFFGLLRRGAHKTAVGAAKRLDPNKATRSKT